METQYQLNGILSQLGMQKAFSPQADFSGIKEEQEPLWIDTILQTTFLQVDEEGTEAAAATFMGGMGGMPSIAPKTIVFCADHPFLFLIRDTRTGCILFMGRVMQPESSTVDKD
jgi:serpin B